MAPVATPFSLASEPAAVAGSQAMAPVDQAGPPARFPRGNVHEPPIGAGVRSFWPVLVPGTPSAGMWCGPSGRAWGKGARPAIVAGPAPAAGLGGKWHRIELAAARRWLYDQPVN